MGSIPGIKIRKYQILPFITQGGEGQVLKVRYNSHCYALKRFNIRKCSIPLSLIKKSFDDISKLNSKHIVKIYDKFYYRSTYCVVMQLCQKNLRQLIQSETPIKPIQKRQLQRQIISAVEYIHQKKISHRDLKPQNILLLANKIKLTDFTRCASQKIPNQIQGSAKYNAPQQFRKKGFVNLLSDCWALGLILLEIQTQQSLQKICPNQSPGQLEDLFLQSNLGRIEDRKIKYIIKRLLACDPQKRATASQAKKLIMGSADLFKIQPIQIAVDNFNNILIRLRDAKNSITHLTIKHFGNKISQTQWQSLLKEISEEIKNFTQLRSFKLQIKQLFTDNPNLNCLADVLLYLPFLQDVQIFFGNQLRVSNKNWMQELKQNRLLRVNQK